MKTLMIVVSLACGAVVGWTARGSQQTGVLNRTDEIIVQHPQQNPYGTGSTKTRIQLYGAGDDDFGPMPENASNATLWIVTIHGMNYRGVAQDSVARETGWPCSSTSER